MASFAGTVSAMSRFRASLALPACAALAVLAACGGGGGTGVTPPGGSGGGTPPPTATPISTSTPAPVTPTPSPSPTQSPVSTLSADRGYTVTAQTGPLVNGAQNWYSSGVTVSWTPNPGAAGQNGDTSAGANAAMGFAPIDGMSCAQTQEPAASTSTYSTHAFVGIYDNGNELALPQAIGMKDPAEPTLFPHPNDNYEVESQACEYNVHTHDYAGIVHVEDVNYPQSTSTTSPLPYKPTLQTLLDVWGVQIASSGMAVPGQATLSGPVAIYHGTPGGDVGPNGAPAVDMYTLAQSPADISLGFHQTIWIVIGALPSLPDGTRGLPQVEWRIQY